MYGGGRSLQIRSTTTETFSVVKDYLSNWSLTGNSGVQLKGGCHRKKVTDKCLTFHHENSSQSRTAGGGEGGSCLSKAASLFEASLGSHLDRNYSNGKIISATLTRV